VGKLCAPFRCPSNSTCFFTTVDSSAHGTTWRDCADDASCILPTCGLNCQTACPFDMQSASLAMTPELENAGPESEVTLYSAGSGQYPDQATITIPACDYVNRMTLDASLVSQGINKLDIAVLLDVNYDMTPLLSSVKNEVNKIIDQLLLLKSINPTSEINISVIPFADPPQQDGIIVDDELLEVADSASADGIKNQVTNIVINSPGGNTLLYPGALTKALQVLQAGDANAEKKLIIISATSPEDYDAAAVYWRSIEVLKEKPNGNPINDISVYTVAISDNPNSPFVGFMEHLSSNICSSSDYSGADDDNNKLSGVNCSPSNSIDYSVVVPTNDIVNGFNLFTESLTSVSVLVTGKDRNDAMVQTVTVIDPDNTNDVFIELPSDQCDSQNSNTVVVQVSCPGTCSVRLRDARFSYCPAR
jgi:hypothetical protein